MSTKCGIAIVCILFLLTPETHGQVRHSIFKMMPVNHGIHKPTTYYSNHMQANSYLGLWGKVVADGFQEDAASAGISAALPAPKTKISERLQQIAGEWRNEAEEMKSRLIQRLNKGSAGVSSVEQQLKVDSNEDDEEEDAEGEVSSLLHQLHDKLKDHESLDARQLATLALIQAVALSSVKKHAIGDARLMNKQEKDGAPFSNKVGVILPDTMMSHFEGQWCMRLQNVGNAAGYNSVLLGSPPCKSTQNNGDVSTAQLTWGKDAAFTLECGTKSASPQEQQQQVGIGSLLKSAAAKVSSEITAALQRCMECTLSTASSNTPGGPSSAGSGNILHFSSPTTTSILNQAKLNTIKIRICNVPPSSVNFPAALHNNTTSLQLNSLRLNGRKVAIPALQALQKSAGSGDGCEKLLIRLPSRALSDGFVLNGAVRMQLGAGGKWGVGEMTSIELQIGGMRLLTPS